MSEIRAHYRTSTGLIINPDTLLRAVDPRYVTPTIEDVKALKSLSGQSGAELARRVNVDSRTWRRWIAPPGTPTAASIPYAAWRLLLVEFGIVSGLDEAVEPIKLSSR